MKNKMRIRLTIVLIFAMAFTSLGMTMAEGQEETEPPASSEVQNIITSFAVLPDDLAEQEVETETELADGVKLPEKEVTLPADAAPTPAQDNTSPAPADNAAPIPSSTGTGGLIPEPISSPAEENEPIPTEMAPLAVLQSLLLTPRAVGLPSFDHVNFRFFANGTPILIKENGGITSAYDATGNTLLSDIYDLKDYFIYGGWENGDETANTSITIESGTLNRTVFGGSLEGTITGSTSVDIKYGFLSYVYGGSEIGAVTGNTSVQIKDGVFTGTVFGGGSQAAAAVGGNTNVTIENGLFYFIYGGGYAGSVAGDASVSIKDGMFIGTVFGGGNQATATIGGNTKVIIENGAFNWVYGGGFAGPVTGDTSLLLKDGTFSELICGGGNQATATVGNDTNITVEGGVLSTIFGGGAYGNVTGDTYVTINGGIFWNDLYQSIGVVYGGGYYGSVRNANVKINATDNVMLAGGTIPNSLHINGGGLSGSVNEANVTVNGGNIDQLLGGGLWAAATTVNTNITIGGTGKVDVVYGGGDVGSISNDVNIVIKDQAFIHTDVFGGCRNTNMQPGDSPGGVGGKVSITLQDTAVVDRCIFGGGDAGTVGSVSIDLKGGTVNGMNIGGDPPVLGGGMHNYHPTGGDVTDAAVINIYPEAAIAGGNTNISLEGYGAGTTVGSGSKINYYYKITYDANTSTGTPPAAGYVLSYSKLLDGSIQQGTAAASDAGGMSKSNHTFAGWNTQPGGGGTSYAAGAVLNPTENITLYAQWAPVPTYPITILTNGVQANGVTATGAVTPADGQPANANITVTVTLTGTATAAGTHTVGLTSSHAGSITSPATVTKTVTAGQGMTAGDTFVFSFTMPPRSVDDLVVTHTFSSAPPPATTDASISPTADAFDKNTADADYKDIAVTLSPGSYTLSAIRYDGYTLQAGTDYTVSGSAYTIKKEYLATLGEGTQTFTFAMSGGANPTLTITIKDTSLREYPVIESPGPWTGSGTATWKIDGPYSKYIQLWLGGNVVNPDNMIVTEGSTVITLKESYLKTLANGTYNYTAEFTDGYAYLTLTVNVQGNTIINVTGVTLNKSSEALKTGETLQLTAVVLPDNATDKSVTWSSSDTSVATVDNSGKVTANKSGTATITVITDDGLYTATCKVTVTNTNLPQTGDNGNVTGWLIALLTSVLGMLCVLVWRKWRQLQGTW